MPNSSKLMAIRDAKGNVLGYVNLYWSDAAQNYASLTPPKKTHGKRREKPVHAAVRFYSPNQVAQMLAVHVETVYRWLDNGTLRGTKISRFCWRISSADFRKYLRANNVNAL